MATGIIKSVYENGRPGAPKGRTGMIKIINIDSSDDCIKSEMEKGHYLQYVSVNEVTGRQTGREATGRIVKLITGGKIVIDLVPRP